jgi:CubicO group peptidase (beta-lactamase class C family)
MKKLHKILLIILIISLLVVSSIPANGNIVTKNETQQLSQKSNSLKDKLFDLYLESIRKLCYLPSISACTIRGNEVVWAKGYGLYDPKLEKQATEETIYLVMSISKPVAATALMQLYEQGLFDLDEDVNNYLPFSLRNPNYPEVNITFRMLLAHQSSLAYDEKLGSILLAYLLRTICIGDPDVSSYPYPWLENYLTPDGNLYIPEIWVNEPPGTSFHYANIGYGLIGYLIELISGQEFADYCRDHIFIPLNMKNTSFLYADLNTSNIAIPYNAVSRHIIPKLSRQPLYSFLWAACGNLKTTVMDLSHFLIAHMNGGIYDGVRILNESTVELMHEVQYQNTNSELYGLGWMISENRFGEKIYGHDGGGPGVHTRMWVHPSDNLAFMYFVNTWTWRLTVCLPLLMFTFFQKAKFSN